MQVFAKVLTSKTFTLNRIGREFTLSIVFTLDARQDEDAGPRTGVSHVALTRFFLPLTMHIAKQVSHLTLEEKLTSRLRRAL
jgi:hypothetical protein